MNDHLDISAKKQIRECLDLMQKIFGKDLLGVYLYGSAIVGGLQKYSDIDLFVVSNRATTDEEKRIVVRSLLKISSNLHEKQKRPIEMTIIEQSAVTPWRYPPTFDFQYGEWLRKEFEHGNIHPYPSKEMPDLAVLITQILLANIPLIGVGANQLLCTVPYTDFMGAIKDSLPHLLSDLESDTRNVLLTLARIWNTTVTDIISSKPAAADWAIFHLPEKYRLVMEEAKAICKGDKKEDWSDVQHLIKPCADFILAEINNKITEIMSAHDRNKSIKIS